MTVSAVSGSSAVGPGLDDGVVADEQPAVGDAPPLGVHRDQQVGVFEKERGHRWLLGVVKDE